MGEMRQVKDVSTLVLNEPLSQIHLTMSLIVGDVLTLQSLLHHAFTESLLVFLVMIPIGNIVFSS